MKVAVPLLLVTVALVVLHLSRRARRPVDRHAAVERTEIARTATHVTTSTHADELLETVVATLLGMRIKGRPPRRYVLARRDHRSVEIAERLVETPALGPVVTVLLEADTGEGRDGATTARFEVLDVLPVDRVVDRLAEVSATRTAVLRVVSDLDPDARFRDELLPLPEETEHPVAEPPAADRAGRPGLPG